MCSPAVPLSCECGSPCLSRLGPGSQAGTAMMVVKYRATCPRNPSTSSADDPHVRLMLATWRCLQSFFWTLLSLLNLRFQMLFWAPWFRGEARLLGGSVKFFGVFQLTCDSIKIIPRSEASKQVMAMLQVALVPPQPLVDQRVHHFFLPTPQ